MRHSVDKRANNEISFKEVAPMHTQHTSINQQSAGEHSTGVSAEPSLALHPSFRIGLAYGHFVHRFRWFLLVLWLSALVASIPFALKLPPLLSGGGFSVSGNSTESAQASRALIAKLHVPPSTLTVVFHSATTDVSDPAYQEELNSTISSVRAFRNVMSVTRGSVGKD